MLPVLSGASFSLREGVLGRVQHARRLVEVDLGKLHADVLEDLIEGLSVMAEGHRAVMRVVLLDQHVAVEASHLRNGEDADAAEGACGDGRTSPWAI